MENCIYLSVHENDIREPQTPMFPPYVNLVNAKDHWKIGESEHNTDCDVTVGITNSYAPTFASTRPCSRPAASRTCTAESSEVLQVLWRNKWGQQRKWQIMEINVPGCAGDVKCRDGLVSVFKKYWNIYFPCVSFLLCELLKLAALWNSQLEQSSTLLFMSLPNKVITDNLIILL